VPLPFCGTLHFYSPLPTRPPQTLPASRFIPCSPVWMPLTGTHTHVHIHTHTRRCGTRNRVSQARKARPAQVLRQSRDCAVALTVIGDMVFQSSNVSARPPVHRFRATSWGRSCWRITRGGCVGTRMRCDVALESVWRGCSCDAHRCAG
jgi:hypothetical protein